MTTEQLVDLTMRIEDTNETITLKLTLEITKRVNRRVKKDTL